MSGITQVWNVDIMATYDHLPHPLADSASPKQWANNITRQQLPVARPPNWNYRKSTTALSISSTYKRQDIALWNPSSRGIHHSQGAWTARLSHHNGGTAAVTP